MADEGAAATAPDASQSGVPGAPGAAAPGASQTTAAPGATKSFYCSDTLLYNNSFLKKELDRRWALRVDRAAKPYGAVGLQCVLPDTV